MKKGFVALALAATLVIALVGMAVAGTSQTWFLTDVASVPPVSGANHTMVRGAGAGADWAVVSVPPVYWGSNEAALVDVGFGMGPWSVTLAFTNEADRGFLDYGETMAFAIGTLSPDGAFSPAMVSETIYAPPAGFGGFNATLTPDAPFTVPAGHRLALGLVVGEPPPVNGIAVVPPPFPAFVHVDVFDGTPDSPSFITSPATDPGFPVFELPTILLMSGGLLALVGYVVYDRRRRRQHLCRA